MPCAVKLVARSPKNTTDSDLRLEFTHNLVKKHCNMEPSVFVTASATITTEHYRTAPPPPTLAGVINAAVYYYKRLAGVK